MAQKTYKGSCHCGDVRYSVEADLSGELITCNCSICGRSGTALAFVPAAVFKLEQGEGALTDYQFGKKKLHHPFCKTCGIRSFSRGQSPDGTPMIAINARCLEGVDIDSLKTMKYDGASQ
ncbi:MAG: GFA family protein [Polyangiales bacterium]